MVTIPEQLPFITPLHTSWYQPYVLTADMLRLDAIHPVVSGNKWYKLKHNIADAVARGCDFILTFGGPYSNHLVATAAAAKAFNIKSVGVVRGINNPSNKLTPTLQTCIDYGMSLVHVAKSDFDNVDANELIKSIGMEAERAFEIPMGGANESGRVGCEDIAAYIEAKYTHVCVAVGTGTTLAGIRNALPVEQTVLGYAPMKKGEYLNDEIRVFLNPDKKESFTIFDNWHGGGFGKWTNHLISFMNTFYKTNQIPLDIVYTGKMMLGILEQLKAGYFPVDAKILCIHTGGLQGNVSVGEQLIY